MSHYENKNSIIYKNLGVKLKDRSKNKFNKITLKRHTDFWKKVEKRSKVISNFL